MGCRQSSSTVVWASVAEMKKTSGSKLTSLGEEKHQSQVNFNLDIEKIHVKDETLVKREEFEKLYKEITGVSWEVDEDFDFSIYLDNKQDRECFAKLVEIAWPNMDEITIGLHSDPHHSSNKLVTKFFSGGFPLQVNKLSIENVLKLPVDGQLDSYINGLMNIGGRVTQKLSIEYMKMDPCHLNQILKSHSTCQAIKFDNCELTNKFNKKVEFDIKWDMKVNTLWFSFLSSLTIERLQNIFEAFSKNSSMKKNLKNIEYTMSLDQDYYLSQEKIEEVCKEKGFKVSIDYIEYDF